MQNFTSKNFTKYKVGGSYDGGKVHAQKKIFIGKMQVVMRLVGPIRDTGKYRIEFIDDKNDNRMKSYGWFENIDEAARMYKKFLIYSIKGNQNAKKIVGDREDVTKYCISKIEKSKNINEPLFKKYINKTI